MEGMIPGPLYVIFLVIIGVALLIFAYGIFRGSDEARRREPKPRERGKPGSPGVCPICGTVLGPGEQIKSAVFPGAGERLLHVFGCPHCHPFAERGIERNCPVCKKKVPAEAYLIARLFERPHAKRHVHILGCVNCRLPKRK